ncbi:MAG: UxaA family hydrolase [Acidimicrobiia bacterium]|nr:MAG: UxaA family hydrolase [Acidimicrobiia bacterium]
MTPRLMLFERSDGRWGTRNHVLVLPLLAAASRVTTVLAEQNSGVVSVVHDWENIPGDPDADRIRRVLVGTATNPNVGAVLMVGLDESDAWFADQAKETGQRVAFVALADSGGSLGAIDVGSDLLIGIASAAAEDSRVDAPLSGLCLGLECGASDAFSGITANPALGIASDMLTERGGTSFLAEITELIGAERLLAARAISPEVADDIMEVVHRFEQDLASAGVDLRGSQPAPGNIAGGLTTLEEKSLGAAMKGGAGPIVGVLEYGEQPSARGLHIMDTPGHDIESVTGMVTAGANIIGFTTGRGTPTGSPVAPTIKISSNTDVATRLPGLIDFDAGVITDGVETLEAVGRQVFEYLIEVANGRRTAAETLGSREFAFARLDPNWDG